MNPGLPSRTKHATRRPNAAPGRGSVSAAGRRLKGLSTWLLIWLVVVPGVAYAKLSDRESLVQTLAQKESSAPLRVTGHVSGLAPGLSRTLRIRIQNHYSSPVLLSGVRVLVEDASDECPARALKVSRYVGLTRIPEDHARGVRLSIRMRETANNSCQGERFPLLFWLRGRAR